MKNSKKKNFPQATMLYSPDHALMAYPMPLKFLLHSPGRPKKWDKEALDRVKNEIISDGETLPILVAPEGVGSNVYHVLTGWLRVRAAADLGYKEVPCIFLDTDGDTGLRSKIIRLLDQEPEEWNRETAVALLEHMLNHSLVVSDKKWLEYLARVDAAQKDFQQASKAAKRKKII